MELKLDASPDDLKVFLEEAYEQLQLMDADLIALEKAGPEPQLLQEIFRAAHTLKGSSASIGHTRMAELTHAMESALDGVRQGRIGVTTELIDLLLESLDALRTLTDEAATLKVSGVDISLVVPRLLQMAEQDGDAAERNPALGNPVDRQGPLLYELQALGNNIFKVSIEIEGSAPLSAARCLQVLLELSALAEIVKSKPTQAELETGLDCHHLEVVCATKVDPDAIQNTLGSIVDVLRVWVVPYEADGNEGGDGNKPDERTLNLGPEAVGLAKDRRVIDLGLEARGKSPEEMLRMAASKTAQQVKTVRIDIERLDSLMNLVGELVIENTRLAQIAGRLRAGLGDEDLVDRLGEATSHLGRLTDELQQEIMKSRMLPIENVFSKFPRMVRNLAHKAGKEIELIINGQETELDRSVIEEIGDPLIHLLRNAVDHGIEGPDERVAYGKPRQGTVRLSAFHQENHIVLTVEDDGRGIDPQRIRAAAVAKGVVSPEVVEKLTDQEVIGLIFAPGFSTTDKLSDISGRGVGMDIVRTNIERLNGTVNVETTVGVGSKFV
ncbi:MAG: chemotaxis protein CheA, partial [Chloroflexota bacterium]